MFKRIILATLAVFVAWQVLDFVIHGLVLMKTYQATASLWRPMNEMKFGLMRLVGLVGAVAFVVLYAGLVHQKSVVTGLTYGLIFGLATGFPMGFGTYCVMPISLFLAVVWCVGAVVECIVGGLLVGWIVKEPASAAPTV